MKLSEKTPYETLSPELILDAVDALGLRTSGALFALNSYENRVYEVGVDSGAPVVVKFYRPHRWSAEQIAEEHAFALDLQESEVDVVPPLVINGQTLHHLGGYDYAVYAKRGARSIELATDEDFRHMGRLVARIHAVGAQRSFVARRSLDVKTMGWDNLVLLRQSGLVPADLMPAYDSTITQLLNQCDALWQGRAFHTRIHGDCHMGNILDDGTQGARNVFFVDLDDSVNGPEIQDLWMFTSGSRQDVVRQFGLLLEGYNQIRDFDYSQLQLVEVLRSLRMVHYVAWLAKRWDDPTFPKNFPFFNTSEFWQRHVLELKEQLGDLHEPLLIGV